jgi:hypothetical protein
MVEKDGNKYVDSCVGWEGVVNTIADADLEGTKACVIPIEGRFAYCGSTRLTIRFYGATGTDLGSSYMAVPQFDYLCTGRTEGIRSGDAVSFVGKVLGLSRRPDLNHLRRVVEKVLIGITEIHRIDRQAGVSLPRWPVDQ